MNRNLSVKSSIEINCKSARVWEVLTKPSLIAIYLYGTKTETDWQVDSPISFSGEYDGHQYHDKGRVLENTPQKALRYLYYSQFSGLEDLPENYSEVIYRIENLGEHIIFTWEQIGYRDETAVEHSRQGMPELLKRIKAIAEETQ